MKMYESPINLIERQISRDIDKAIEGEIWKVTTEIGVVVDKDELIKALEYDRDQYKKGYQDAKDRYHKVGQWIEVKSEEPPGALGIVYMDHRCSRCGYASGQWSSEWHYCPICGAKMEEE
jgi:rubrerythrin